MYRAADGPAADPIPVQIGSVTVQTVTPHSWIPGSIVSRADARIASVVGGRVVWVAEVGLRVKSGAPIARLDDTQVRLRVVDLQAQVARAQLDMTEADVTRADSQLHQAQQELADSQIRAPFAGVVTERFIQQGEYVPVGAATVRLVNTGEIEARATAALEFAANIRPGQIVMVRERDRERAGRVRAVVPVGDDRSRQFEVRVVFDKADWLVGTSIEVSLPTAAARTAVNVPRDALVIRANRSYVLRVTRAGTVEELDVLPGVAIADLVEVRGAERLTSGQPVEIVTEEVRAPKAAADAG